MEVLGRKPIPNFSLSLLWVVQAESTGAIQRPIPHGSYHAVDGYQGTVTEVSYRVLRTIRRAVIP